MRDVDGLNSGYAQALLDEYLENPDAVPPAWRALFESGDPHLIEGHPGLVRLLEQEGQWDQAETACAGATCLRERERC